MAARALATKFPAQLKELRLHLCQKSAASQGVRDFIENSYVTMKQTNPKFPILIRECSGVVPKAWARYELGREASVSLEGLSQEQVQAAVSKLATSA